jgi:hypothetical protein
VKTVKRKLLVLALAVALLVLPMSAAVATAPTTVITGTLTMLDPMSYGEIRYLGDSGNQIWTFTDAPFVITGDIEGTGVYNGKWLMAPSPDTIPPFELKASDGWYTMDVAVDDVSGQLTIRLPVNGKLIVVDGTGELKNLHGTGTLTMIEGTMGLGYLLTINAHWDP